MEIYVLIPYITKINFVGELVNHNSFSVSTVSYNFHSYISFSNYGNFILMEIQSSLQLYRITTVLGKFNLF